MSMGFRQLSTVSGTSPPSRSQSQKGKCPAARPGGAGGAFAAAMPGEVVPAVEVNRHLEQTKQNVDLLRVPPNTSDILVG